MRCRGLANGEQITAALVIAADGREFAAARRRWAFGVIGWSYPQTGIVATVEHEKPHNGVAYEHFLPSGPFAILPMTGQPVVSGVDGSQGQGARAAGAGRGTASMKNWRGASARIWARPRPRGRAGPIRCPSIWRAILCARALRWRAIAPMAFIPSPARA